MFLDTSDKSTAVTVSAIIVQIRKRIRRHNDQCTKAPTNSYCSFSDNDKTRANKLLDDLLELLKEIIWFNELERERIFVKSRHVISTDVNILDQEAQGVLERVGMG